MKTQAIPIITWITLSLTISIFCICNANQTHSLSRTLKKDQQFLNKTGQYWRHHDQIILLLHDTKLELSTPMLLAGIFCFMASAISSAGGIGGGGLFIPILTILAGLDLKTASTFSAFMVTGGSVANVLCNLLATSDKVLIDFDIALLSEPCMLLGVSVGVICNVVFPEWLITILFAVFLAWSTFKTCKNGILYWRLESEVVEENEYRNLSSGNNEDLCSNGCEESKSINQPLLSVEVKNNLGFPWLKLVVLVLVWFSFSFLYLLRGNRYGEGITKIEPCGWVYWILSALQIPLAVIFTSWILFREENCQNQSTNHQDIENSNEATKQKRHVFPLMALLAGVLGGVFGSGGGMLINPLLLHVGIAPEVSAATCAFMVSFSSTMSAFQYLMQGMEQIETALIFTVTCFIASLLGLLVIQRAIKKYGRASLVVFSVSVVMVLSTVLMTSFGALDVWRNYKSGKNMGFKLPC